ncbi:MAG: hypothetical protein LBR79_01435 [Oscillospiraceae bacterium]|nr:hypothetical protein [Oscillospiraceae bacterium]
MRTVLNRNSYSLRSARFTDRSFGLWTKFIDNIFSPRHRRGEKKEFQLFWDTTGLLNTDSKLGVIKNWV